MIYDVFVDYVLEPALARALLAARYVRDYARKGMRFIYITTNRSQRHTLSLSLSGFEIQQYVWRTVR